MAKNKRTGNMLAVYQITKRNPDDQNEKGIWKQIGVAFMNSDGSFNMKFDCIPTDWSRSQIHVREKQEEKRNAADATDGFEE